MVIGAFDIRCCGVARPIYSSMDANENLGTNDESVESNNAQEKNNENANEESESWSVNGLEGKTVSTALEENKEEICLHKLYKSIVTGEKDSFCKIVSEILRTGTLDLNEASFEGDYVSDVHRSLTTIQLVCGKGDEHMLRELLNLNIDVNSCGKYGKTPLNIACLHGHFNLVQILISKGANLDACNVLEDCDTALITTVACYQPELHNADTYLQIGHLLLEAGANPNKGDKYGVCAVHSAVIKSDDSFTKLLIRHGASVNAACINGATPLCKALDAECYHNAKLLLKYGCEINEQNSQTESSRGPTPLYIAITKNNLDIILSLLNSGADANGYSRHVNESVYQHSSVLHLAASEDRLVTLWLLLAKGGNINSQHGLRRDTPLLILARKGSVEGVKMLLRFGADVELESQVGTTPIWAAVRENHPKVLHVLLETCCSLEIPSMEYHMYMPLTPLEIALRLQSWKMALTLLNAGASHKTSTLNDAIPAPVPLRGQRIIRTRAAYRLSPEDHQALKELRIWKNQPKMLRHMCRTTLRSHFTIQLPKLLKKLNYPIRLQNYLYMKQ